MGVGFKIKDVVEVERNGVMEQFLKDFMTEIKKMGKENLNGHQETIMLAISKTIRKVGKA